MLSIFHTLPPLPIILSCRPVSSLKSMLSSALNKKLQRLGLENTAKRAWLPTHVKLALPISVLN